MFFFFFVVNMLLSNFRIKMTIVEMTTVDRLVVLYAGAEAKILLIQRDCNFHRVTGRPGLSDVTSTPTLGI
jgi:hypothetical protein